MPPAQPVPVGAPAEPVQWVVEAWRALAAWLVVCAHFWSGLEGAPAWLKFSFTGVNLFFVLSGYVFAPYFFGRALQTGAFALRRFFRIYPAYVLALVLYMALHASAGRPLQHVAEHLVFAHLQSREMAFYYNPVFWSLPAEVEFYLLLPLMAWACRRQPRAVLLLSALALVLRLVLGWYADRAAQNAAYIAVHHLPGLLSEFLLGVWAWRWAQGPVPAALRWGVAALALALWLALAAAFARWGDAGLDQSLIRGQVGWLAALAFAALVWASAHLTAPAPWAAVALWAGGLSYGSYLLHSAALRGAQTWGLGVGATTLLASVLTVLGAWGLHRFWEDPWRRYGRRLALRGVLTRRQPATSD